MKVVRIIQIVQSGTHGVNGLGDDNRMYYWNADIQGWKYLR